ncbi:hypothetical protein T4A_8165, partial [Trichinella pseudospiralis]
LRYCLQDTDVLQNVSFSMTMEISLEKKKLMARSIAKIYTLLNNRFGSAEDAIKKFDSLQKKEEQLTEKIAFVTAENENFLRKEEACNCFKQNIAELAKKYDIHEGCETNSLSFEEIEMLFQNSIHKQTELLNVIETLKLCNKNLENSIEKKSQQLEDAKVAFEKEKSEIYEKMNTDFAAQAAAFLKEKDELLDRINSVTEESELLSKMLAQETEKSNAIKEHYENENNNLKCENEKILQENAQLKESTEKILQQLQSETEVKSKKFEQYECFLEYLWKKIDHEDREFEILREQNRSIMKKNENLYSHLVEIQIQHSNCKKENVGCNVQVKLDDKNVPYGRILRPVSENSEQVVLPFKSYVEEARNTTKNSVPN